MFSWGFRKNSLPPPTSCKRRLIDNLSWLIYGTTHGLISISPAITVGDLCDFFSGDSRKNWWRSGKTEAQDEHCSSVSLWQSGTIPWQSYSRIHRQNHCLLCCPTSCIRVFHGRRCRRRRWRRLQAQEAGGVASRRRLTNHVTIIDPSRMCRLLCTATAAAAGGGISRHFQIRNPPPSGSGIRRPRVVIKSNSGVPETRQTVLASSSLCPCPWIDNPVSGYFYSHHHRCRILPLTIFF